ncbi:hypothetical protein EOD39_13575 [Acipenser ruthenus]|uniref:Uncharacterized protein n=1 Tax=Acipenser ruthenus TaxID=7906 RepID=A0A444UIE4_ACIRT|nr:hypothetical protein EOD39_13575 [Acipenser ruthenus]
MRQTDELRDQQEQEKRKYIDDLTTDAEEAAKQKEKGTAFKVTRRICGSQYTTFAPSKVLTSEREQERRWAEHFKEIFNKEDPQEPVEVQETFKNINQLGKILQQLSKDYKIGKHPALTNSAELFKVDSDLAANILLLLFTKMK